MSSKDGLSTHIDKLVVYLFIGAFLVSASALAFKYARYTPCKELNIEYASRDYRVGDLIKFQAQSEGAKQYRWDIGDSTSVSSKKDFTHVFENEGEYEVRLLVNNICEDFKTVMIMPKIKLKDPAKMPIFKLPESVKVGQKFTVTDESANASSWAWRFGESDTVDATDKQVEYAYTTPGIRTVALVINDDYEYITYKDIIVTEDEESKKFEVDDVLVEPTKPVRSRLEVVDTPETPPAMSNDKPKVNAPYISNDKFAKEIVLVAEELRNVKSFSQYFCGDIDIPVVDRGEPTTFLAFCEKIKGEKLKSVKVTLYREDSTCITKIVINYKRRGLFKN